MIEPAHHRLSISTQCRLLRISRSSYYNTRRPHSGLAGRTPVEAYQRIGQSDHGGHATHALMIKQAA